MQLNDLNALTIPEGNVLSIYSDDTTSSSHNFYPVANMFNPDGYEKETEAKIVTAVLRGYKPLVGKSYTATIKLTDGVVGTDGYVPILYDRMNGVVTNLRFTWSTKDPKVAQAAGRALWPKGKRVLDIYVITPEQKIIGPTSLEMTVR